MNPKAHMDSFLLPDLSGLDEWTPWMLLDASGGEAGIKGFLAAGVRRSLTLASPTEDAFEQIQSFVGNSRCRCFGWIGYDQLRADPMLDLPLQEEVGLPLPVVHWIEAEGALSFEGVGKDARCTWFSRPQDPRLAALIEQAVSHPIDGAAGEVHPDNANPVWSSLDREGYLEAFGRVHAHIERGDLYELNLCRELRGALPAGFSARQAFSAMVRKTGAPYSAHLSFEGREVLSVSPECFLEKRGNRLTSRPIKGTAPRHADPMEDARAATALKTDVKERAENVMITDLVRNDLSRVAAPSSVQVEELCGIHSFRNVHQMISTVSCTVRSDAAWADILRATFPMGSMTGAPKLRAMEITAETEPVQRGLYSGTLGWADPDGAGGVGDFHLNVVIRTAVVDPKAGSWSLHVGGALTALAQADAEWAETRLKAKALLEVLGAVETSPSIGPACAESEAHG